MRDYEAPPSSSAIRRQTVINAAACLGCYSLAGVFAVWSGERALIGLPLFFAGCAGMAIETGKARIHARMKEEARAARLSALDAPGPK